MESKHPHEVIPKIIKRRKMVSQIADTPFYQLSDLTNVFTLNFTIINGRTKPLHKWTLCFRTYFNSFVPTKYTNARRFLDIGFGLIKNLFFVRIESYYSDIKCAISSNAQI